MVNHTGRTLRHQTPWPIIGHILIVLCGLIDWPRWARYGLSKHFCRVLKMVGAHVQPWMHGPNFSPYFFNQSSDNTEVCLLLCRSGGLCPIRWLLCHWSDLWAIRWQHGRLFTSLSLSDLRPVMAFVQFSSTGRHPTWTILRFAPTSQSTAPVPLVSFVSSILAAHRTCQTHTHGLVRPSSSPHKKGDGVKYILYTQNLLYNFQPPV